MSGLQKCEHSAFCTRLRGVQGQTCSISPSSIVVEGSSATASVLCGEARQQYDLALTAYDGILRLHVNEAGEAGKKRFQVPHALVPDLDQQAISWDKHDKSSNSLALKIGQADITLQYSPLQLDVNVGGKPAISFNSKQLFNFEHLRQKQVMRPCSVRISSIQLAVFAQLPCCMCHSALLVLPFACNMRRHFRVA